MKDMEGGMNKHKIKAWLVQDYGQNGYKISLGNPCVRSGSDRIQEPIEIEITVTGTSGAQLG